jgi:predicted nucleic acid-binding protein
MMNLKLDRFTGAVIYLDTMLPYALFRGVEPEAKAFFERIERGDLLAYTSALTFDELAYRLVLALIRDRHGGAPLDLLRADEARLIAEFAPTVTAQLQRLRRFPHLTIVDVTAADLEIMERAMVDYAIRPRDALHLAAMVQVGCYDLASHDAHFDRIPHIRRFTL